MQGHIAVFILVILSVTCLLAEIREEMEFDYSITNELLSAVYVFQEAVSNGCVVCLRSHCCYYDSAKDQGGVVWSVLSVCLSVCHTICEQDNSQTR